MFLRTLLWLSVLGYTGAQGCIIQNCADCSLTVDTCLTCLPGFFGSACDNIDECAASESPCQNQGTCTDQVNGYTCECVAGFIGDDCETDCGNLDIVAGSGELMSIDHPGNYPNNADCTWTITAPEGMAIRFVMETFNLQNSSRGVCRDYFELAEPSGYSSTKLCQDAGQDYNYLTVGNVATVTFHSNPTVTAAGFSLHYEVAEAGHTGPKEVSQDGL